MPTVTTDILLLETRILNTILLKESHFREFKSAMEGPVDKKRPRPAKKICDDIAEALVAFANADGGEILIGVEDDGTITGIPHSQEDIALMQRAPRTHVFHAEEVPLPLTFSELLTLENRCVLYFAVNKGSDQIYQLSDGRCLRRKDRETIPVSFRQIQFDRQEIRSREYDRQFIDNATVSDLDGDLLRPLADQFLRGISVERYLQQTGLAEYYNNVLRLRKASLLLFAKKEQLIPECSVRIRKVRGTEVHPAPHYNVLSDLVLEGNIFQLIQSSWENLRNFLVEKTDFSEDARFEQRYIYPEVACREALINAIAHRDYSRHNGIEVSIFDDRMEIKNPGALLSTLTVEDLVKLQNAHESRNALIARILRENKYIRESGEGMKRIFEAMEKQEYQAPDLHSNTYSFTVNLFHKPMFSIEQKRWLELFDGFGLTPNQRRIVVLGMDDREISRHDIITAIRNEDRDVYDQEVTPLRNAKILYPCRTPGAVANYHKQRNIPRSHVPRFKVRVPEENALTKPLSVVVVSESHSEKKSEIEGVEIFVHNLPWAENPEVLIRVLEEELGKFGKIIKITIPKGTEPEKKNRGFGFILLENRDSVEKVISLDGRIKIQGKMIGLKVSEKNERQAKDYEPSVNKNNINESEREKLKFSLQDMLYKKNKNRPA